MSCRCLLPDFKSFSASVTILASVLPSVSRFSLASLPGTVTLPSSNRHLFISLVECFVQRRRLYLSEFVTKCLEVFSSTLSACVYQRFCFSRRPTCSKVSLTQPLLAIQPTSTFPSVSQIVCISIFGILLGSVPTSESFFLFFQCVTKCLDLVVCRRVPQRVDQHFSFTAQAIYCLLSSYPPAMALHQTHCLEQCLHLYFREVLQSVSTFSPLASTTTVSFLTYAIL